MNNYRESHEGVIQPEPETDYHGHPNYTKVFFALIGLLAFSLVLGFFTSPMIAVSLIFFVAIIKAGFVVGNFMHLKFEPILIWIVIGVVIFILATFFLCLLPDVTFVERILAK